MAMGSAFRCVHRPSPCLLYFDEAPNLLMQQSTNVWVDHCEFYSGPTDDKDYYDGLVDVSHAADFITISKHVHVPSPV
jgi:pectate lyase